MESILVENTSSREECNQDEEFRGLLKDYVVKSIRRPGAVATMAVRHQATSYRDILAFQATAHKLTYAELKGKIQARIGFRDYVRDPLVLAQLARVVLLQDQFPSDATVGESLLSVATELLPVDQKSRLYRRMLAQYDLLTGNYERAQHLSELYPDIDKHSHQHLRTDLLNPFLRRDRIDYKTWQRGFNAPFRRHRLLPVQVASGDGLPFDRLTSSVPYRTRCLNSSSQLVSVVVTSYQPTGDSLVSSVTSLLNQTWTNLEVIVVNDSSGPEYDALFERVADLDDRIRVMETASNSGTYLARNLGFGVASGKYMTGQDDDDWSHPERIERQVAFLEAHEEAIGCRVHSIACTEDLVMTRLGKGTPQEANASSLMLSRETWGDVGGFLPVRKAADTELFHRVQRLTHKKVVDLEIPLTIIRKAHGSLSHQDFSSGWRHPARRHFRTAYTYWHKTASDAELRVTNNSLPRLSVPRNFRVIPSEDDPSFDVIFAGDWSPFGGPQRSMLEEIKALLDADKKIGVLHLDPARFMFVREREMCDEIIALINAGVVTNVLYDDPVATKLLILRYPPIMQFPADVKSAIRSRRTIILANQAPKETDGSDIRYIPAMVQSNTERIFDSPVSWVPQSKAVREALWSRLDSNVVEDFDMPGILNIGQWYVKRPRSRSSLPVVGRHSRDNAMKWPEKASAIRTAYPLDGSFDIRVLGGATVPLSVLKQRYLPGSWTVYETNQISPQKFLSTLDFYVFFQHTDAIEAFGRSILEALASGLVVILPGKFKQVFGEAAVYCEPDEVPEVVRFFHEDRDRYAEQVKRSLQYVNKHFSYVSYTSLVESLIEETNATIL